MFFGHDCWRKRMSSRGPFFSCLHCRTRRLPQHALRFPNENMLSAAGFRSNSSLWCTGCFFPRRFSAAPSALACASVQSVLAYGYCLRLHRSYEQPRSWLMPSAATTWCPRIPRALPMKLCRNRVPPSEFLIFLLPSGSEGLLGSQA